MAAISYADTTAQLADWLAASTALASSQSYTINGRTLTRANLADVQKQIEFWETKVNGHPDNPNKAKRSRRYSSATFS